MAAVPKVVWKNLTFTVPWGFISGKECGPSNGKPFLGLHGWLDNANSFDNLAPFLSNDIHFVVIDFPGHGLSSHKPPGTAYDHLHRVVDVRRVINQLGWKEFSIIGHSMGAAIGTYYACTFPSEIRHLVFLDIGFPRDGLNPADTLANYIAMNEKETKPVVYPDVEAIVARMVKTSYYGLKEECARILAKRGCVLAEDGSGFQFSHDRRIKTGLSQVLSLETRKSIFSRIKCSVLRVKACDHLLPGRHDDPAREAALEVIRENAKIYKFKTVSGSHHVHMDNPELVAREIEDFIRSCQDSNPVDHFSKL